MPYRCASDFPWAMAHTIYPRLRRLVLSLFVQALASFAVPCSATVSLRFERRVEPKESMSQSLVSFIWYGNAG